MLVGFAHRRRRRRVRLVRLHAAVGPVRSPGLGGDLWIVGIVAHRLLGHRSPRVNIITTVFTHAHARHDDVPHADLHVGHVRHVACWSCWRSPCSPRAGAAVHRPPVRRPRSSTRPTAASRILWQHLFWFFGHPEVYIVVLPFFGVVTEIFPVFARRPLFGYSGLVFATLAIAALSVGVWAHHMFVTGRRAAAVLRRHVVPDRGAHGRQVLQLDRHDVGRLDPLPPPMLFSLGFLVTFLLGGLTGVMLASPPLDFHVSDTLLRGRPLPLHAGRRLGVRGVRGDLLLVPEVHRPDARRAAGRGHFWLFFIGFNMTFLVQHVLGRERDAPAGRLLLRGPTASGR